MTDDLDDLAQKIRIVKGEDDESLRKKARQAQEADSRAGMQAGVELVVAVIAGTAIGYGLDSWLGTKPLFLLIMFFLGVCTGFYNVYRISQNMGTAVGNKSLQNDLPDHKKDAN
jgi:ATP synthase protein I